MEFSVLNEPRLVRPVRHIGGGTDLLHHLLTEHKRSVRQLMFTRRVHA